MTPPKDTLRKCPVCSTKLTDELVKKMGVRHYQAMDAYLPGKVRGADIDYVLQSERGGIALIIEFKPTKARLGTGQMMFLRHFRQRGDHVWVVVDKDFKKDGTVHVGVMQVDGTVNNFYGPLTIEELGNRLCSWWEWAQGRQAA